MLLQLLIVLLLYFEFILLLTTFSYYQDKRQVEIKEILQQTFIQMKKASVASFFLFIVYLGLLLPFSGITFHSEFFAKLVLPPALLDFIFGNRVTVIASTLIVYLVLLYGLWRLIFILPEKILTQTTFKQATKSSLQLSKKYFGYFFKKVCLLFLILFSCFSVIFLLSAFLQKRIELHFPAQAAISAVIVITLLQTLLWLSVLIFVSYSCNLLLRILKRENLLAEIPATSTVVEKEKYSALKPALVATLLLSLLLVTATNFQMIVTANFSTPIIISHRGVSENNGVQNTLPALYATAEQQPDYIEIDIQLTKDKEFILFHDFDLAALTGITGSIKEKTVAELQELTLQEGQVAGKIATFSEYLQAANQLGQKLIIEIKSDDEDTEEVVQLFLEKYQAQVLASNHLVQSLRLSIVEELKKQLPQLTVGYIIPFNLASPPDIMADFFAIDYLTINPNFIHQAHAAKKKVFVWTVNTENNASRMRFYNADGIITDNLSATKKSQTSPQIDFAYSQQLLHFVTGIG